MQNATKSYSFQDGTLNAAKIMNKWKCSYKKLKKKWCVFFLLFFANGGIQH